tara:strand:- start:646 stop:960 length:315 start_codon:yes stop_codon:yes gene_type:complete
VRVFLFKLLFRLTWWVAPDTPRVNRVFDLYLEEVKKEEDFIKCQKRQAEMDATTQPRTETYEHLTCERQREVFSKFMPPRISDKDQPRSHYSDYEEAKEYHESS